MEKNIEISMGTKIEDFLDFKENENQKYTTLFKYSQICQNFTSIEIMIFYIMNYNTCVTFECQKYTITEILFNTDSFMNGVDDELYCFIICNLFIIKNKLIFDYVISKELLNEFSKNNELIFRQNYFYYIPESTKTTDLISKGKLPFFISKVMSSNFPQSDNNSFKQVVHMNIHESDPLMSNNISNESIKELSNKIIQDPKFEKRCKNYITSKEIETKAMQIIASFYCLPKKSILDTRKDLHSFYCGRHFNEVYVPFSEFEQIGDLSKYECYLIYLINKTDLKCDLEDISLALKDEYVNYKMNIDNFKIIENSIQMSMESINSIPFTNESIDLSLPPINYTIDIDRSWSAEVLNLIFKTNLIIEFDKYSFRNLKQLYNEPYINTVLSVYARNIIESGIEFPKHSYLDETRIILDLLSKKVNDISADSKKKFKNNNKGDFTDKHLGREIVVTTLLEREFINCSLDSLPSCFLHSSLESQSQIKLNENCKIQQLNTPFIKFDTHKWLNESEVNILMEEYIEKYDINKLCDAYIIINNPSEKLKAFFTENYQNITDKCIRARICCELDLEIDLSLYTSVEINELIANSKNIFNFRKIMMLKKTSNKILKKLFCNISTDKMDIIVKEATSETTIDDFMLVMMDALMSCYDFSHFANTLISIIRMGRISLIKHVQAYFINQLKQMYIDESYLPSIESLYYELLEYDNIEVKTNNDKILILIINCAKAMDKEVLLGNIKQS